jgi:hypothetical protein
VRMLSANSAMDSRHSPQLGSAIGSSGWYRGMQLRQGQPDA